MIEDDRPRPKREVPLGGDLSLLSIEELEARIAALEAEIARCRASIEAKTGTRAAADALFRRG